MTPLSGWQNFYVIVGSSAGALIGLQFVAMSFIAGRSTAGPDAMAGQAFGTPTIVHFSMVLGLSGILTAPWERMNGAAVVWGIAGIGGVVYAVVVMRRMRVQSAYKPEFEDWLFHILLPFASYAALAVLAWTARYHMRAALFGVGSAVLLLLFVGIHNAWDAVTYHIYASKEKLRGGNQPD